MARQGTELLVRMCDCIVQMHEGAEEELISYMADLGITWSEDWQWRTDFLRLLEQQNEQYRKPILRKLRAHAAQVIQVDLESLQVQLEAVINSPRRLQTQLSQVEGLYVNRSDALQPTIKEEVLDQIDVVKDLVQLVSTRTRGIRTTLNAVRRELYPMLSERALDRLRSPLPARVQRRPLYLIAERLRALRAMRMRIIRKADRMRFTLTALANRSLPDDFAHEVTQLRDRMQKAGWRQSDMIHDLECLLIEAEGNPSFLVLDGKEVSLDHIFQMIHQYEQLPAELEALHKRVSDVEGRLSSLASVLVEPRTKGPRVPDA